MMVILRIDRIVLFFLALLIGCSPNSEEEINYERDFDKLALVKITKSNQEKCLLDAISSFGLDSLGGPLKIVYPYYIRNYQIKEEDVNFSIVKDQNNSFHFISLKKWNDIIFDKEKLYRRAEVDYSDLNKMNNFPMLLKDSIDLLEIDTDSLEFLLNNEDFNFNNTTNNEFSQQVSELVKVLEQIEYPFLTNKVGLDKINYYLDNHLVKNELRGYLKDTREIRIIIGYEEWFGYCLVVVNKTRSEISMFCLPFERRQVQFRSDGRKFNCW